MTERIFRTFLVLTLALVIVSSCKRREVIADNTLVDIFHDAFLTNAYLTEQHIDTDSIDVYHTIFERYGYTEQDLKYTIGNFSRRKSAQLGKILSQVTKRLEEEASRYRHEVVILDTIKFVALRASRRILAHDSLSVIKNLKDSSKIVRSFDVPSKGTINLSYEYVFDKDPIQDPRRLSIYLVDNNGVRRSSYSVRLRREDSIDRRIEADSSARRMVVEFASIEDRSRKREKNSLKIKNLHITFTPDEETAIDSLYHSLADIALLTDDRDKQKDSVQSPI